MSGIIQTLNTVIPWIAIPLWLHYAYIMVFHKGVPPLRTAPAIRRAMIALLKEDMARRPDRRPYTIVDLGSGRGVLSRHIAREIPEARVIGIEISWQTYKWAERMRRYSGLENLSYRNMDFFRFDISQADAIVMFMLPWGALDTHLRDHAKKDTLIITNKFPLCNGWVSSDVREAKSLYPFQKKYFVYRA